MSYPSMRELVLMILSAIAAVIVGLLVAILMLTWLGVTRVGAHQPDPHVLAVAQFDAEPYHDQPETVQRAEAARAAAAARTAAANPSPPPPSPPPPEPAPPEPAPVVAAADEVTPDPIPVIVDDGSIPSVDTIRALVPEAATYLDRGRDPRAIWAVYVAFADHPVSSMRDALAVSECESHFVASAKNRQSSASGIYQMLNAFWDYHGVKHGYGPDRSLRFNPEIAAELTAKVVAADGGWQKWECAYLVGAKGGVRY